MIDPNAIAALKVYPPIGVARVGNAKAPATTSSAPR